MTKWIELREKIRKIYGKHNRLILAVVKFILALFLFLLINHYVGYMEKLHPMSKKHFDQWTNADQHWH